MIAVSELLKPEHVELCSTAADLDSAVRETAALLKGDLRVDDWKELAEGLEASATCLSDPGCDFGVCIPHARTDAVSALTMSAARYEPGLPTGQCEAPIRYVFCIGAPQAMETDYLRIVGLLVRIVKDPKSEPQLRSAATPEEFVETLAYLEAQL